MPVPLSSAAISRVIEIGNQVAAQYPRAFSKCHVEGDPENMDFIILFARAAYMDLLLNETHKPGMNGKRGNPDDPSLDVLNFKHNAATSDTDVTTADVVSGAGGTSPKIYYNDVTDPAGAGAVYIDPYTLGTYYDYGEPQPPKPEPTHDCLLSYSLFWAVGAEKHDPARLDEQLRQYKDHGADGVRVIAHLPRSDADGTPGIFNSIGLEWSDSDFCDYVKRTDDHLAKYGLFWMPLTFTAGIRGIEDESKQSGLVEAINRAFEGRSGRRVLDEMANEYEVNGLTTHILRHLCRENARYVQRALWVSLSSPHAAHGGPGDLHDEVRRMYDGLPEANAITPHWDRTVNEPPDLGPYSPDVVICNEPRGPMSSITETSDPAVLVGDYQKAAAAAYRCYVGHSDSGFISTFMYPGPSEDNGHWRLYSDHHNGPACLVGLRDYRKAGSIPEGGGGGGGGTPVPPTTEHQLLPGQFLVPGQALVSPGRTASFQNQLDGNLVVYYAFPGASNQPIWSSATSTPSPGNLKMQEDGNTVLSDAQGNPIWASNTAGHPGAMMQIQDDGYVVWYVVGTPIYRIPA